MALILYLVATIGALHPWRTSFFTNRLFDVALLYIITCSIIRIRKVRRRGAPPPRVRALEFAGQGGDWGPGIGD